MRLKIASRKSDLARLQALSVGRALAAHFPVDIDYHFKASLGDKNQDTPLWTMGDKGVFTQDFYQDLVAGRVDLVVHSWKDLPIFAREHTCIAATLPRADLRDLLLVRAQNGSKTEPLGERAQREKASGTSGARPFKILTSSPRREHNLRLGLSELLPFSVDHLEFLPVRGNVPTRIEKLMNGEGDALVVAKAALDRLLSARDEEFLATRDRLRDCLKNCHWMVLPMTLNPAAAAQGALAIEVREDRQDLLQMLAVINDAETYDHVLWERQTLASYGGGCHQKIGVVSLSWQGHRLRIVKGVTDAGQVLDEELWQRDDELAPWPRPNRDQVWPEPGGRESFFERVPRQNLPLQVLAGKDLWVARADAWPKYERQQEQVVWASGLKTWRKLAKQGVWVNGCNESLGEDFPVRLEALTGRDLDWLKLTHDRSEELLKPETSIISEVMENGPSTGSPPQRRALLATYHLQPKVSGPCLKNKTHFFWRSGSAFLAALESDPETIKQGFHACGPGNTYSTLAKVIKDGRRLRIYLSQRQWWQALGLSE